MVHTRWVPWVTWLECRLWQYVFIAACFSSPNNHPSVSWKLSRIFHRIIQNQTIWLQLLSSSLNICEGLLMLTYSALMYYSHICCSWHRLWWEAYLTPAFTLCCDILLKGINFIVMLFCMQMITIHKRQQVYCLTLKEYYNFIFKNFNKVLKNYIAKISPQIKMLVFCRSS